MTTHIPAKISDFVHKTKQSIPSEKLWSYVNITSYVRLAISMNKSEQTHSAHYVLTVTKCSGAPRVSDIRGECVHSDLADDQA